MHRPAPRRELQKTLTHQERRGNMHRPTPRLHL